MAIDEQEVLKDCMRLWGADAQMLQLMEECAELIVATAHFNFRSDPKYLHTFQKFVEELADVEIMCAQMRLYVGDDAVDETKAKKFQRLSRLVEKERSEHQTKKGGETDK